MMRALSWGFKGGARYIQKVTCLTGKALGVECTLYSFNECIKRCDLLHAMAVHSL